MASILIQCFKCLVGNESWQHQNFTDPEHCYNPGKNRDAHRKKCMVPVCRVNWLVYVQIVQISSPVVFVNLQGGITHPRDQLFTSARNRKNLDLK